MGVYLNEPGAYGLFQEDYSLTYYVDKTEILPIAKYSSGSELNMFFVYSMATRAKYSEYFGFTDEEVDDLYQKYLRTESEPRITREGLEQWYDGYQTAGGKKLYNPRSVIGALSDNQLGSYWTSSGKFQNTPDESLRLALPTIKRIRINGMSVKLKCCVRN